MDVIKLEIWIDRSIEGIVNLDTYKVATNFKSINGSKQIHVQRNHVGIQGHWTNTWRPRIGSREIGLRCNFFKHHGGSQVGNTTCLGAISLMERFFYV